jgi:hypothetical protein
MAPVFHLDPMLRPARVIRPIPVVLAKAEAERAGLKNRIDNVLSVAAIVGGNDIDDYLTRTEDRSQMLRESDAEIRRGQNRLRVIEQNISHFKFLRAALQTRFPDCKMIAESHTVVISMISRLS